MARFWHWWRRRRWWIRYMIYLAIPIGGFYAVENVRGFLVWKNYRDSAVAEGENFEFSSYLGGGVPDDENFEASRFYRECYEVDSFSYPIQFSFDSEFDPHLNWARKRGYVGMIGCQPYPVNALFPNEADRLTRRQAAERFLELTEHWERILESCHEAVRRPARESLWKPRNFNHRMFPHVPSEAYLDISRLLVIRSQAHLVLDSPDEALEDVKTLLLLAEKLSQGITRSEVQDAELVFYHAYGVIWEGLWTRKWTVKSHWPVSRLGEGLNLVIHVEGSWKVDAMREIAMIAAALEVYRMDRDIYPELLEELVPDYLNAIPIDPFSGGPMRYERRTDGTPLIYSIGIDQTDDGGRYRGRFFGSRDIGWQYSTD